MELIFDDAQSAAPTPASQAERGSLMGGLGSPSSFDIRRGNEPGGPSIPNLHLNPPTPRPGSMAGEVDKAAEGEQQLTQSKEGGIGTWISSLINRGKDKRNRGDHSQYRQIGQHEDE